MIPFSCAASSASQICFAIVSASSTGMGPRAIRSARVSPSTSSRTRKREPLASARSYTPAMFVIQRGQNFGLTLKPAHAIGIAGKFFRQDLDCNFALQFQIACAIHLTHAAFAKQGGYLV